jgi:hypothetical protein
MEGCDNQAYTHRSWLLVLLLPSDIARARFHNHAGIDERGWALPPGV